LTSGQVEPHVVYLTTVSVSVGVYMVVGLCVHVLLSMQEFVREQKRSAMYQDAFGSKARKTDLVNIAAIATEFIPPLFEPPPLPADLEPEVSEAYHARVADSVAADAGSAIQIKVVLAATVG
jgi:hypothetical protein